MPRVSDAHLTARREQILNAARACFLRSGIHQTSMQDVVREAGLSVGAVYRYFPSKADLVAALAEQIMGRIATVLNDVAYTDPPPSLPDAVRAGVNLVCEQSEKGGFLPLALQVWNEAQLDPALQALVRRVYGRLLDDLERIARRAQQHGQLPPDTPPRKIGAAFYSLLAGYALQRMLTGGPPPGDYVDGVRALLGGGGGAAANPRPDPAGSPTGPAGHQGPRAGSPVRSPSTDGSG